MDAERRRLIESDRRDAHWRRWGPFLAERAWGTVRVAAVTLDQPPAFSVHSFDSIREAMWSLLEGSKRARGARRGSVVSSVKESAVLAGAGIEGGGAFRTDGRAPAQVIELGLAVGANLFGAEFGIGQRIGPLD